MQLRQRMAIGLGILLPALVAFPTALTAPLARDEQMYVTAAALARDHTLYHDFAYFQMPYLPWIQAPILGLAQGHYLMPLRLFAAGVFCALAWVTQRLVRRATGSEWMGLAASLLVLCSETVLLAGGIATNHLPALLAFTGAIYFCTAWIGERERGVLPLLAGLCLGIAVGLRLTYLAYLPLALLFFLGNTPRPRQPVLRCLAGFGLALVPALLIFLRDPAAFWFDNLQYHLANARWWEQTSQGTATGWATKLSGAWDFLEDSSHLPLWITALACTILLVVRRELRRSPAVLACGGLFLLSLVFAVLPRPVPVLYFLPAVVALVLWAAVSAHSLQGRAHRVASCLLIACVLIALGDAAEDLADSWRGFLDREDWTPRLLRDQVASYRDLLEGESVPSISPVLVLEMGARVPPEFSTGPFFFRVGDSLREEQRMRFHGSSPSTVAKLLESLAPAAVLTGADGNSAGWDEPLLRWSREAGYLPEPLEGGGGILWITPAARSGRSSPRDS